MASGDDLRSAALIDSFAVRYPDSPLLDELRFRFIPDEGTRLDSVISGTIDVAHTLRQGTIRDGRAARDGGEDLFLYEFQGNNLGGGYFNALVPPFDDPY